MTQECVAECLGVSSQTVSKWETGKAKPSTNLIRKIAVLFGLSLEQLLKIREGEKHMETNLKVLVVEDTDFKYRDIENALEFYGVNEYYNHKKIEVLEDK